MRHAARWAAPALLALTAAALGWSAARADDEKVSGDLKKMQGTWVRAGDNGPDSKWVIKGDSAKIDVNGQEYSCTITLDPKANPHPSADLAIKDGPGDTVGKTSKGIYKFDGDRLVICVAHPGGEARPAEFKTVEGETFIFDLKPEK